MAEHRRKDDDELESSIHSRRDDPDTGKRLLRVLLEYRILWLFGMGAATWFGSRIVQPLRQTGTNTEDIISLKKRADLNDSTDREWREVVKIVVRVQCNALSEPDKYKYNLCHPSQVVLP